MDVNVTPEDFESLIEEARWGLDRDSYCWIRTKHRMIEKLGGPIPIRLLPWNLPKRPRKK